MKSAGRYSWRAGLGLEDHEEEDLDSVFARSRVGATRRFCSVF